MFKTLLVNCWLLSPITMFSFPIIKLVSPSTKFPVNYAEVDNDMIKHTLIAALIDLLVYQTFSFYGKSFRSKIELSINKIV